MSKRSPLWGPLVLINLGCLLRVTGQTLTDFTPAAFPVAGMSGLLEVTGLALWGIHLALVMTGRARTVSGGSREANSALENRDIRPSDTVAAVLTHEPRLIDTFVPPASAALAQSVRDDCPRGHAARPAANRRGRQHLWPS
jgi:hypothetical protein